MATFIASYGWLIDPMIVS